MKCKYDGDRVFALATDRARSSTSWQWLAGPKEKHSEALGLPNGFDDGVWCLGSLDNLLPLYVCCVPGTAVQK